MRKFYLEIDGVRISLNNESGIFFTNPSGLGTTMGNSFTEISDGFFRTTNKKQKQGSIAGDLTFFSSAYTAYETFVNSLFTAKKIVFVYDPAGVEYFIDVELNYITKTESVLGAYMTVPISFIPLSMWYTETTLTGTGSVSVSAGGHIGAAVVVEVSGELVNPVITLASGGEAFAACNLNYEMDAADVLEYSTLYDDSHVYLNGDDAIGRVFAFSNLYSHKTGAFTVSVTDDNSASPSFTVVVRKYWRTV